MFRNGLLVLALLPFLGACQQSWTEEDGALHTDKRVGIGTAKPEVQLAVKGTIHAQEVKITVEGWPDYVFEDGYPLPSLEALGEHVRRERRLPGMPSAGEVEAEGLDVGSSQRLLLEKVEELTLHVLALKRENDTLRERVEQLEGGNAR
jgi:hypothetical protein